MAKTAVIIVAAGKGERFGAQEKKIFAKIDGRPMFLRTLEHFINREDVCQTILVISPDDIDQVKEKYGANLGFMGVTLVEGGAERHDSVAHGLAALADDVAYVAIHDAARPCVSVAMIDAVFEEATKSGAAILAAPLHGTIKRGSDAGVIEETIPRENLWEAQTPQVFKKSILCEASEKRGEIEGPITDDAQLVEVAGHPVALVPSDCTNLKITTKGDVTLANSILRTRPKAQPKGTFGAFEEAQW